MFYFDSIRMISCTEVDATLKNKQHNSMLKRDARFREHDMNYFVVSPIQNKNN